MVFFNCNACGESLKKNQVEKHYQFKCRSCEVLSCVDCGQEFWGDSYNEHTKCISEEAKYSGKDYKPKPNANKGEVKQDKWTREVQAAIDRASANPKLRQLLERMKEYTNIPRKKSKFENFVKNSMRVHDSRLVSQVWDLLSSNQAQTGKEDNNNDGINQSQPSTTKGSTNQEALKENKLPNETADDGSEKNKLSKKERKEERRKKQNKEEKKDRQKGDTETEEGVSVSVTKKPKKKKHQEEDNQENGEVAGAEGREQNGKQKKKKKHKKKEKEDVEETLEPKEKKRKTKHKEAEEAVGQEDITACSPDKFKFSWEGVIIGVLKAADEKQLSIKRLRKKVLAEYEAKVGDGKTKEKLLIKFNKKIHKNQRLKVHKDRVKLIG